MIKAVLIATALAASACGSDAATMKAVVTGTTGLGFDATGLYGPPQQPLFGQAITATFIYDTNAGLRDTFPGGSDGGSDWLRGGGYFSMSEDPTVSGSVTIGTVTTYLSGSDRSEYLVTEVFPPYGSGRDTFYAFAQDNDFDFASGAFSTSFLSVNVFDTDSDLFPFRLDVPFSLSVPAGTEVFKGEFEVRFSTGGQQFSHAFAPFVVETITVSQIPLPASALLLVTGFGVLGGLANARRRRAASA